MKYQYFMNDSRREVVMNHSCYEELSICVTWRLCVCVFHYILAMSVCKCFLKWVQVSASVGVRRSYERVWWSASFMCKEAGGTTEGGRWLLL